ASGHWRDARKLVMSDSDELLLRSALVTRGLSAQALDTLRSDLSQRAQDRREALDRDWSELDRALSEWLSLHEGELERRLEGRTLSQAGGELRLAWEAELARRGLEVEQMPLGLAHEAYEALEKRWVPKLADLERTLATEDARLFQADLERETA